VGFNKKQIITVVGVTSLAIGTMVSGYYIKDIIGVQNASLEIVKMLTKAGVGIAETGAALFEATKITEIPKTYRTGQTLTKGGLSSLISPTDKLKMNYKVSNLNNHLLTLNKITQYKRNTAINSGSDTIAFICNIFRK
jgi:hypothetical protein